MVMYYYYMIQLIDILNTNQLHRTLSLSRLYESFALQLIDSASACTAMYHP